MIAAKPAIRRKGERFIADVLRQVVASLEKQRQSGMPFTMNRARAASTAYTALANSTRKPSPCNSRPACLAIAGSQHLQTGQRSCLVAADVRRRAPAGRWGETADLVGACRFLASAASDYVNGIVIAVDGTTPPVTGSTAANTTT